MSEERMITELTGRLCKLRVSVQYGQISRHLRLCRIVKVESAGGDGFYVTIKIEKGEKGAGRRIRSYCTNAEMVLLEKNSWGYVPATKTTIERLKRRKTQDRTRETIEYDTGHNQVS